MELWGFSKIDVAAFSFFILSWVCHFWVINQSRWKKYTISHHMYAMRVGWMREFMRRNPKMFDALIQNQFQQGVLFFASTSILIVGAMLAGLGSSEQAIDILTDLPFSTDSLSRTAWELKLLTVTFIFVFSFFKFAWSYRQFNYIMIVAGAAPDPSEITEAEVEAYAQKLAAMHSLAALHFTTGLNAYFFALAAFAWFLNAWAFILATVWVTVVLYRRAFRSKFMKLLSEQSEWFDMKE